MSSQAYIPIHNNSRYEINLSSDREDSYIIYRLSIFDLTIGIKYQVKLRFSQIKKLHDEISKKYKDLKDVWPELPKTNSIAIWNRTNKDHRKIEQRRRQLQYYFDRILNNPMLRALNEIKVYLIDASKSVNRTQSSLPVGISQGKRKRAKSLPHKENKIQY